MPPHGRAFAAYLRSGDDEGLRVLDGEAKSLSTAINSDGGFLVEPRMADGINTILQSSTSLRAVATTVTVEASAYEILVDQGEWGAGWVDEATSRSETDTPTLARITVPLHELAAMPKASQRLLDDAAFDVETWLSGRIAEKFARTEAAAFIAGDGDNKPTGILHHPQVANASWIWGKIGHVTTGASGALGDGDTLVDLVYSLAARYRANAVFVMNSKTAGSVRKLKDADKRFLWSDGLAAGEPARLLGHRVLICEDMPDIADGATAIAFGDFAAGYTIAERPDLRVLRDPFSAKPHVLFYATRRIGGDISDFAAIKLLKFSNT